MRAPPRPSAKFDRRIFIPMETVEYWISGPKKDGRDRWGGKTAPVEIDPNIADKSDNSRRKRITVASFIHPSSFTSSFSMTTPLNLAESTVMVVWPTMGRAAEGRLVGRIVGIAPRLGTPSSTTAEAAGPGRHSLALAVFAWQLLPLVPPLPAQQPTTGHPERFASARRAAGRTDLDQFETVEVEVLPGQGPAQRRQPGLQTRAAKSSACPAFRGRKHSSGHAARPATPCWPCGK